MIFLHFLANTNRAKAKTKWKNKYLRRIRGEIGGRRAEESKGDVGEGE